MIKRIIVLLATLLLSGSVAKATVLTINPTDARSVRFPVGEGQYFVLDFLSVMNPTEDRAILEFDVSGLSETVPLITLDIWFDNIDPEPPVGIIDVFTFIGDGVVTADDFYAGGPTPFTSFIAENGPEYGYASIDVTSAVRDVLTANEQFVGFRLSTETEDRFNMGNMSMLPDPILTVIPEPTTVLLLGLGALAMRKRILG